VGIVLRECTMAITISVSISDGKGERGRIKAGWREFIPLITGTSRMLPHLVMSRLLPFAV
jgi:hypothetical protein